jgi:NO-binding membrane sensor protein with MHYT domain/two-component sensor histidine kinase
MSDSMRLADFFHPHDPTLVIVSLSVAILAAYTSLDLAGQIRTSRGRVRLTWLAVGAVALGGGIWSMHFIGMLALMLPVPVRYDVPLTILSLVIPILLAALGFYIVHWRAASWPRLLLGGAVIGVGISVMHYTGMAALEMPAVASYVPQLVAVSVAIAIAASTVALWLAGISQTAIVKLCGSSLGIGISGLHYTAVAGFICSPTTTADLALSGLSPAGLAPWVAAISLTYLWSILIFGAYDRRLYARSLAEAHRLELLTVSRNAQEEERLRIARELHDQMGQDLTALSLVLKTLEPAVQTDAAREPLRVLQSLTAEMNRKIHDMAWELRPSSVEAVGLRSALENYASDWSARFKIAVDFHGIGLEADDLPALVKTTIFQTVQEAFTNILKHAAARNVSLVAERGEEQLRVIIDDDGRGLDRDAAMTQGQLGLVGIRERLALIGGTLSIEAASPTGTTIIITVPLTKDTRDSS